MRSQLARLSRGYREIAPHARSFAKQDVNELAQDGLSTSRKVPWDSTIQSGMLGSRVDISGPFLLQGAIRHSKSKFLMERHSPVRTI